MSDTPRTDRDSHRYGDASFEWRGDWVPACACRIIERELNAANDRIKRLENIIFRASTSFFEDGSDRVVAVAMLMILDEAKEAKP